LFVESEGLRIISKRRSFIILVVETLFHVVEKFINASPNLVACAKITVDFLITCFYLAHDNKDT
jgi:hypothetical protein